MNEDKSTVTLFIDDETQPIAILHTPVRFELDTKKLTDGEHCLRIVSKSPTGREGIKLVNFLVRNGPAIDIEGLRENQVVDGVLHMMINAYDKGDQKSFMIVGSETPSTIPSWLWILLIAFAAWAMYYLVLYFGN